MPRRVATLQEQLNLLNEALASGASAVDMPGIGRVTYRTVDEIRTARDDVQRRIDEAAGTDRPVRRVALRGSAHKGL